LLKVRQKIVSLDSQLKRETAERQLAEKSLHQTADKLGEMSRNLDATREAFAQASIEAQTQHKRASKLAADLTVASNNLHGAKTYLARYQATGMEPEEIVHSYAKLKSLQLALEATQQEQAMLERKLRRIEQQSRNSDDILLPPNLKTRILAYDPKWQFVVLDNGSEQGLIQNAELLVGREGRFVGMLKVRSVQKNRSIGNLVSGEQLGHILEGDFAIPAHPAYE
jgi:hypothetical protein